MEDSLRVESISKYAIVVHPDDNVAVAKREIAPGTSLGMADGRIVCVTASVTWETGLRLNRFLVASICILESCGKDSPKPATLHGRLGKPRSTPYPD
jgi:hypothetical protein